jgi:hypothetical protein
MNYIKDHKNCWTVVVSNPEAFPTFWEVHTFDQNHPSYDQLVDAIRLNDEANFLKGISIGKSVQEWSKNGFTFTGGVLYYQGEEIAKEITAIVLDMISGGFNEVPILNFMVRLFKNPSSRAVKELYSWLSHKSLAICEDGCFLAYKSVNIYNGELFTDRYGREVKSGDYVDKYTSTIRNNVGDVNDMPRRKVNDDFQVGCSDGFHVGSLKYVTEVYSSNKQIICKVDPADVVSVPLDCDCQKIRCCYYEVISEFKNLPIVEMDKTELEYAGETYDCLEDDDDTCGTCGYSDHWDEDCEDC